MSQEPTVSELAQGLKSSVWSQLEALEARASELQSELDWAIEGKQVFDQQRTEFARERDLLKEELELVKDECEQRLAKVDAKHLNSIESRERELAERELDFAQRQEEAREEEEEAEAAHERQVDEIARLKAEVSGAYKDHNAVDAEFKRYRGNVLKCARENAAAKKSAEKLAEGARVWVQIPHPHYPETKALSVQVVVSEWIETPDAAKAPAAEQPEPSKKSKQDDWS